MEKTDWTEAEETESYDFSMLREATPDQIPNAVIARLVQEIRNDDIEITAYNRFHNRHNR